MNQNSKVKAGGRSPLDKYGASNVQNAKTVTLRSCQSISFTKTNRVKEVSARDVKEKC